MLLDICCVYGNVTCAFLMYVGNKYHLCFDVEPVWDILAGCMLLQHIHIMTDFVLFMTLSCGHKNPQNIFRTDSGHSMTLSCGHKNLQTIA